MNARSILAVLAATGLATASALVLPVTLDNDPTDVEEVVTDGRLTTGNVETQDSDGDGDPDVVRIGTKPHGSVEDNDKIDNDATESELIVSNPKLPAGIVEQADIDHDGDPDIIFVGTKGKASVACIENVDNDPSDQEIVVETPRLPIGTNEQVDIDMDGDADVIYIGTGNKGEVFSTLDVDMDGDLEIHVRDPRLQPGEVTEIDLDHDGDTDVIISRTGLGF